MATKKKAKKAPANKLGAVLELALDEAINELPAHMGNEHLCAFGRTNRVTSLDDRRIRKCLSLSPTP